MPNSVDIYPTLVELAGLPAPQVPQPVDGLSMVPVLRDPEMRIRDHGYHCFPRGGRLGRAIRTDRYRLVEWQKIGDTTETPQYELYDYQSGPFEVKNIAAEQPEVRAALQAILAQHPEPMPSRPQSPRRE